VIFVTVGTNEAPFDRLLRAVDELQLDEELVVQHGASSVRPRGATCLESLAFDDLVEHVRGARVVVTHAGVGSILVGRANGRRPVVVPRLQRFGEAVDDHQLGLARRLAADGVVTLVEEAVSLRQALASPPPAAVESVGIAADGLEAELRAFLSERTSTRLRA
jgi:exopolysaccharide biosynthesis glucuronosyltransferase PssE